MRVMLKNETFEFALLLKCNFIIQMFSQEHSLGMLVNINMNQIACDPVE